MNQKLYIYNGKTAFLCPACNKMTTLIVSDYIELETIVHVACECLCGYSQTAFLERRRYQRKEITLPGIFSRYREGRRVEKKPIVVMELSLSGMRFSPHMEPGFVIGDAIWIKFNLNNYEKSLIKKEAMVVNIRPEKQVGVEFRIKETFGPIRSYLFD